MGPISARRRLLAIAFLTALFARPISSAAQEPVFQPINPEGMLPVELAGFGDPANTWVASMKWFHGSLFVGTLRSAHCVFAATLSARSGLRFYPPPHSDCAEDPRDLALAAEIWRYSPADASWDLVFASPENVPIAFSPQGLPTKFTARDIAFPAMEIHVERDGTEALYVGGTSPAAVFAPIFHALGAAPPPRLLRSVDGNSFSPVPQDPGTFLGSLGRPLAGSAGVPTGFGRLVSVKGQLAALLRTTAGGTLLASGQPASGNNAWAQASPRPEELPLSEVAPFNDALYLALAVRGDASGYAVVRTDLEGAAPFVFVPVLERLDVLPTQRITTFAEHRGRLYAGTSWPSELLRVERDDTWEIVAGHPAVTLEGDRLPLAGMPPGFGNPLNALFTSMTSHDGSLYAGTMDASALLRFFPPLAPLFQHELGFDLLRSEEGVYWYPVTRNGLGSFLQYGVQSLASTPAGLFAGTGTGTDGAQVWIDGALAPAAAGIEAPYRLEAASTLVTGDEVVLSWEPVEGAVVYHLYRSTVTPLLDALAEALGSGAPLPPIDFVDFDGLPMICDNVPALCSALEMLMTEVGHPGPFVWLDATTDPFYVDFQPTPFQAIYFVRAQLADGTLSGPSNVVAGASSAAPVTFPAVDDEMLWRLIDGRLEGALRSLTLVRRAGHAISGGNIPAATRMLDLAEVLVESRRGIELSDEEADDLCLMVYRLRRNVQLVEWDLIPSLSIMDPSMSLFF